MQDRERTRVELGLVGLPEPSPEYRRLVDELLGGARAAALKNLAQTGKLATKKTPVLPPRDRKPTEWQIRRAARLGAYPATR